MRRTSPSEAGFDTARLARVREVLERCVEDNAFPGGVFGIARHGGVVALEAFGNRDDDPVSPAGVNTLYDLASVTKPVACASAAMVLMERGRLHLGEEARTFFPEFSLPHWAGVTLGHLLTHTSGLPDWTATYLHGPGDEAILRTLFAVEMKAPPGQRYEYSCLGYIILGKVLERACGEGLDTFTKREIFEPLGMASTGYRRISTAPRLGPADDVAPTKGGDRERGKLYGEVHDGNSSALDGVSGNAGLFGTAPDLLRFGQMLLNGGELEGTRVLSPLTVSRMIENRIAPQVGGHTWGLFCAPNGMLPSGDLLGDGSAGHTGFTGTSLLVHPGLQLVVVLLTNRVLCGTSLHLRARRLFHNAVAAAITDP